MNLNFQNFGLICLLQAEKSKTQNNEDNYVNIL